MNFLLFLFFMGVCFLTNGLAQAQDVFNLDFIHGAHNQGIANEIASNTSPKSGRYYFHITVNQQKKAVSQLALTTPKSKKTQVCLSYQQLTHYGIILPTQLKDQTCINLSSVLLGAIVNFDFNQRRVDISVPQIYMQLNEKNKPPVSAYNNGINALLLNYNFDYNDNHELGFTPSQSYTYLSLDPGINLGAWRLRDQLSYNSDSMGSDTWQQESYWAQRDFSSIRSRLQLGKMNTNNPIFNSFSFQGVRLSSVQNMLPDDDRGYAPIIHGVANTNSRVEVYERGILIYSTSVAPGPFVLRDVEPIGGSGKLYVVVKGAGGSQQKFSLYYSSINKLLKSQIGSYQLVFGRYDDGFGIKKSLFTQMVFGMGIGNGFTPYIGVLLSHHYQDIALSLVKSLDRLGAVSVTNNFSWYQGPQQSQSGNEYKAIYEKTFDKTETSLQLGISHASKEFNTFSQVNSPNTQASIISQNQDVPMAFILDDRFRMKNSFYINLEQPITQSTSLYFNYNRQNNWSSQLMTSLQLGLNSAYERINYSLYLSLNKRTGVENDRRINLTCSIPLNFGSAFNTHATYMSFTAVHSGAHQNNSTLGVNGSLLQGNNLSYSLQVQQQNNSQRSGSINLNYQGSGGNVGFGYFMNNISRQVDVNVSGGIIAHSGGLTFSQPLADTLLLVNAPDASHVGLENETGIKLNQQGYAVVPYAQPYHYNEVALQTDDFPVGLDIPISNQTVVPTYGSVTEVKFNTYFGLDLLIQTQLDPKHFNMPYPELGALVFNANGRKEGVVGENGEVYISGVKPGQTLTVKWGKETTEQCSLALPKTLQQPTNLAFDVINLTCE